MAVFSREAENDRRKHVTEPEHSPVAQTINSSTEDGIPQAQQAPDVTREATIAPRKHSLEAHAYLDPGCKVSGKLNFEAAARIDGQIDGEINAEDSIVISESALVTAKINAASIILAGTVSGEITASQRIEIRPSARVQGTLTTPKLVIYEGAVFEGRCAMRPEKAHDGRKVSVLPNDAAAQAAGNGQADVRRKLSARETRAAVRDTDSR
jgi:cytoskeletal protein CcmA (bactofilin family)